MDAQELHGLLVEADKAGDAETVRRLLGYIDQLEKAQPQPAVDYKDPRMVGGQYRDPNATSSLAAGFVKRAAGLGSTVLKSIDSAADWANENIADFRFSDPSPYSLEGLIEGGASALKRVEEGINYQPEEDETWEGLKKRAASGDVLGTLKTFAKASLATGITSAPDMIMAAGPGIVPYIMGRTQEQLDERRKNNGGVAQDGDFAAALTSAVGSALLERVGAKAVGFGGGLGGGVAEGGVKGALKSAGTAMLGEGATEALQNPIEYLGTHAGTEEGVDIAEMADQAAEGAVLGAGSGGMMHGIREASGPAARLTGRAVTYPARAIRDRAYESGFQEQLRTNPTQFESDLRVQRAYESERFGIGGDGPVVDTRAMNNLWKRYEDAFKDAADALHDAKQISDEDYNTLVGGKSSVLDLSARHVNELNEGIDVDRIMSIKSLDEKTKRAFVDAARDLNTLSQNARQNRRIGPAGEFFRRYDTPTVKALAGPIGFAAGGPIHAGLAMGAALAGPKVGDAIDRFLETQEPAVLRGASVRSKLAEKAGIEPASAISRLGDIVKETYANFDGVTPIPKGYFTWQQKSNFYKQKREEAEKARQAQKEHEALLKETEKLLAEWDAKQGSMAPQPPKTDAGILSKAKAATMRMMQAEANPPQPAPEAPLKELPFSTIAKVRQNLAQAQAEPEAPKPLSFSQIRAARQALGQVISMKPAEGGAIKVMQGEQARLEQQLQEALEPILHDPALVRRGQRATLDFMMKQVRETLAAAQKERDAAAAAAEKAEREAKEAEEDAQKWDALIGGQKPPSFGGWKKAIQDQIKKDSNFDVSYEDIKQALQEVVQEGIMTEEQAKVAWYVPGARIAKSEKWGSPYYLIQDKARVLAAKRAGVDLTWDNASQVRAQATRKNRVEEAAIRGEESVARADAKARAEADTQAQQELDAEKAAEQVQAMRALILARGTTPEQLQRLQQTYDQKVEAQKAASKARREAKRAAPTEGTGKGEKAASEAPSASREASKERTRQEQIQSVVSLADKVRDHALETAPTPALRGLAAEIAAEKYKSGKQALLKEAYEKHTEHRDWIDANLKPLAAIGGKKAKK